MNTAAIGLSAKYAMIIETILSVRPYARANIPMLPVLVGDRTAAKYVLLNTLVLVPYSIMLYFFGLGLLYLIIASLLGAMKLTYDFKLIRNPSKNSAWKSYKVSNPYLAIIFLVLMFDAILVGIPSWSAGILMDTKSLLVFSHQY